jgi:hypothetical protein
MHAALWGNSLPGSQVVVSDRKDFGTAPAPSMRARARVTGLSALKDKVRSRRVPVLLHPLTHSRIRHRTAGGALIVLEVLQLGGTGNDTGDGRM